jgi:hypothetical protein
MSPQISVDEDVFRYIMDVAEAAGVSPSIVIRRKFKVDELLEKPADPQWKKVYFTYKGTMIRGQLNSSTRELLVLDGVNAGRRFKTPSEASAAVVGSLNPTLESASRNGWRDWRLSESDELIDVLRGGKIDLEDLAAEIKPHKPKVDLDVKKRS